MKKTIVYLIISLMIAGMLCGCSETLRDEGAAVTDRPERTEMPILTPDVDDGLVDDTDGVIGDEEEKENGAALTPGENVGGAGAQSDMSTQPSTKPSEKPAA